MPRLARWTLSAVLALGLPLALVARAEDAPPTTEPDHPPDAKREAALRRAEELNQQVGALYGQQKHAEATALAREVLALREEALGKDHPKVAESLHNLGVLLRAQGAYSEARRHYERALAIFEKALGRDHLDVAEGLDNLGAVLCAQGLYDDARPLLERALAIRENALGESHPDVAATLSNLAYLLHDKGAYAEARPLYERALAIWERNFGKDHPEVATGLNNLAELLRAQGAHPQAQLLYERALAIWEKALGRDHPEVATGLNNLALALEAQGAYAQARPLYERAVAIWERSLGQEHPKVAAALNNLAVLLRAQGAWAEARVLYERALAIREKALGKNHPDVALTLNNLGVLLSAQGAYAEARPLLDRALAIREKVLGTDHVGVAQSLDSLASLLKAQGAYAEARPLYERALAIYEKALGADHPDVAATLGNLAEVLRAQQAYAEARPLLERALEIREKAYGEGHPYVATSLGGLAVLLGAQGAHAEARPHLERALAIWEKALGEDHPDVATGLNNLAWIVMAQGAYAEARPLFERALAIREKTLGAEHPGVAQSLSNLARLLGVMGALAEARPLFERSLAITERHVRRGFSSLSPRQRLALTRSVREHLDGWLLAAPRMALSGHREALRMRGLVARAEAAERALLRRADAATARAALDLQAATRLAGRLANEVPTTSDPAALAAWQKRYAEATAERERLALDLARRSEGMRGALERLDLAAADVQRALPADAALLDLLRVGNRYAGWVLRATGEAVRVELGAAETIEAACEAFASAVAADAGDDASRRAVARTGAEVRRLVWEPLEAKLGEGVREVVVCPDAALASVPFAALPGKEAGRSLLDDLSVSFVSHPFDLVPSKDAPPVGTGAVAVGGVDYASAQPAEREATAAERPPVLARLDRAPRGGASFDPLLGTLTEAQALRGLWGVEAMDFLSGNDATEARLREAVKGKRVVHVATHGFAREDLLAGLYDRKGEDGWMSADAERQFAAGHDPMLLSGLAMAGANAREGGGGDDGILTALEASYLNLEGVDLVTLSACETARGTAESGEGVLGLVSAFQMAGARHVVASLWKVDDEATRLLMGKFYEGVLRAKDPLPPAQALREAALWLRDLEAVPGSAGGSRGVRPDEPLPAAPGAAPSPTAPRRPFASPRYWAAFVAYGG